MDRPEWDDEDDDLGPEQPLLPAEQRWWRHPSELAAAAAPPAPAPASRRGLVLVAALGVVGLALTVTVARLALPTGGGPVDVAATSASRATPAAPARVTVAPSTAAVVSTAAATTPAPPAPTAAATSETAAVTELPATTAPPATPAPATSGPDRGSTTTAPTTTAAAAAVRATAVAERRLVAPADPLAGATAVTVVLDDGTSMEARVLAVDAGSGLAVLEPATPVTTVAPGRGADLAPGDTVHVGGPDGPVGEVVAVGVDHEGADGTARHHLLQLRLAGPADSGAVLLDGDGRAVGLCLGDGDDGSVLAAPIEIARGLGANVGDDGGLSVPWLGVTVRTADGGGAVVQALDEGGPAADAGLAVGDVVEWADGRAVRTKTALVLAVRERRPGTTIVLGVERDEDSVELTVTVGERPTAG